ncbi:hypothetical protein JW906_00620 [bacterium]|nr:hypothetical protein [bacterium]
MKTLNSVLVLIALMGAVLVGCSDLFKSSESPVEPTMEALPPLAKSSNVEYEFSNSPEPLTANPADYMKIAGNTLHMKDYPVTDIITAPGEPRGAGRMEHVLSLMVDVRTGEGTCHGSFKLYPEVTEGGYWEGTYEGYRSKTEDPFVFTLPLKCVSHGKGGTIDGMQGLMKANLIVYTNAEYFPLPIYWVGTGTGVIKEH